MSALTRGRRALFALCLAAGLVAIFVLSSSDSARSPAHAEAARHATGRLPDGATYVMDVPEHWNGTVLLFSHGLVPVSPPGQPNPAQDAPGPDGVRQQLLKSGYALVGSSYVSVGWVADTAVPDQVATLKAFRRRYGHARRTIAWGESLGGMITSKLAEEHGDLIDGSLSLCGTEAGGVARWNNQLDLTFVLRTLLDPGAATRLTAFPDRGAADASDAALLGAARRAQRTEAGRARLALAAAIAQVAGYNAPEQKRPASDDWHTIEANQYADMAQWLIPSSTQWRQDAEHHAGGSMSWNTGVDYTALLHQSPFASEARAFYRAAGLSLDHDLHALATAPRIPANGKAVEFMARSSSFTGKLTKPQLNVHTTADGLVPVQNESAYRAAVDHAGASALLRQTYVDRAGHCNFTAGETLAAVRTIEQRVANGHWSDTSSQAMNTGSHTEDRSSAAHFVPYRPGAFPRAYDLSRRPATAGTTSARGSVDGAPGRVAPASPVGDRTGPVGPGPSVPPGGAAPVGPR